MAQIDRPGGLAGHGLAATLRRVLGRPAFQAAASGLVALAVYLQTLAPTVMWYDMGEFATAAITLGIAHNTGYPLYLLLGKLFSLLPIGPDLAYRVNFMSAFFAALTVSLTYTTIHRLTHQRGVSFIGSMVMAFSSTLWANATWAEVYTLNAFFTILIILILLHYRASGRAGTLLLVTFLLGLGLGNHRLLAGLGLPVAYAGLWRFGRGLPRPLFRRLGRMVLAFLLGFSIHLYLPIRAAMNPPVMWADAADPRILAQMIATGMQSTGAYFNPFSDAMHLRHWGRIISIYPAHELTVAGLFLGLGGGWIAWRQDRAFFALTMSVLIFTLAAVSIYGIHDIFNYFLPIYQVLVLWLAFIAAEAIDYLQTRRREPAWLTKMMPTDEFWGVLPILLLAAIPLHLLLSNLAVLDRSDHRNPADFSDFVFDTVEEGSYLLTDYWTWTPLLYGQLIQGQGRGVRILPVHQDDAIDTRQVLNDIEARGEPAYIATIEEDSPKAAELAPYYLKLLSPAPSHGLPTDARPLPAYKDLLVPRGALYRVTRGRPAEPVAEVPPAKRSEGTAFGQVVSLEGYSQDQRKVAAGEVLEIEFYWRLLRATDQDLWADVLFTDLSGRAVTAGGEPIWQASHYLGGGAFPTSEWEPRQTYRERYRSLVPRQARPGTYEVRILVYSSGPRENRLRGVVAGQSLEAIVLAEVELIHE